MEAGTVFAFFPHLYFVLFLQKKKKKMITHENLCLNTFINILVYFILGVLHIMPSR